MRDAARDGVDLLAFPLNFDGRSRSLGNFKLLGPRPRRTASQPSLHSQYRHPLCTLTPHQLDDKTSEEEQGFIARYTICYFAPSQHRRPLRLSDRQHPPVHELEVIRLVQSERLAARRRELVEGHLGERRNACAVAWFLTFVCEGTERGSSGSAIGWRHEREKCATYGHRWQHGSRCAVGKGRVESVSGT